MDLRAGDRIRARRERWRVESAERAGDGQLLTLRGLGPSNLHDHRALLTPFDAIEPISSGSTVERVYGRGRWRRACRAVLAAHGGWLALRTAVTASLDVMPHQLEPALAVLRGHGCRVLLADDVGLGKTVQAGLLVSELLARGAAGHALFLTPAGLRDQWAHELTNRFGLSPVVADLPRLHQLTGQLPPGVNPWSTINLAVASLDFVKRPEVLPLVRTRGWDLVLVDEAHLVSPESDRCAAVAALCALAAFVVLVTATPHSGDRHAFEVLCALGSHEDPLLVFRRTRDQIELGGTRHVHRLVVKPGAADVRVHAALDRYASAVRRDRGGEDQTAQLLLTILWKRALSSPASLYQSVARRHTILGGASHETDGAGGQLWLPLQDAGGELDVSDEAPVPTMPALRDPARERTLLRQLMEASTAALRDETKIRVLDRLLRRLERLDESVIVFTEYRDTLVHVHQVLARDAVMLHGGMSRAERHDAVEAFTSGSCRLLLATDAGGEGLNLHHRCRCVIHLELPWNPMRVEQRTGRVDRIGQRHTVHSFYLVLDHSAEGKMLRRLRARVERAQRDVGATDPFHSSGPASDEVAPIRRAPVDAVAVNEAERILRGRLIRGRPVADAPCDIAACVRARGRRRAPLNGRALVVLSIVAEDARGRILAARAVGLRVELAEGPGIGRRAARDLMALRGSPLLAASVEDALRRFSMDGALDARNMFWATARRRARSIEELASRDSGDVFQPGLFDRRAERQHRLLSGELEQLVAASVRRREDYAEASQAPTVTVRTRLVLVPHR